MRPLAAPGYPTGTEINMSGRNGNPTPRAVRFGVAFVFACLTLFAVQGCGESESGAGAVEDEGPSTIITQSGVEMVLIPGGWFDMGDEGGNEDEAPVHRVWVDAFLMDKYEVTQDQYRQLQLSDASRFEGDRLPVEQRTWIDAIRFCNERSYEEGLDPCYDEDTLECAPGANGYRLPTEAEWEYAARAGTGTRYHFGDDPRRLGQYAWTENDAGRTTHEVGTKRSNPWGLYDMYGNVAEWVHDYYGEDYYRSSPERNPRGPEEGEYRVVRGGGWSSRGELIGSSHRSFSASVDDGCMVSDAIGFRCVRPPIPSEVESIPGHDGS
jgi:formylglycine-generating enzyme required for sulfatase activity